VSDVCWSRRSDNGSRARTPADEAPQVWSSPADRTARRSRSCRCHTAGRSCGVEVVTVTVVVVLVVVSCRARRGRRCRVVWSRRRHMAAQTPGAGEGATSHGVKSASPLTSLARTDRERTGGGRPHQLHWLDGTDVGARRRIVSICERPMCSGGSRRPIRSGSAGRADPSCGCPSLLPC